MSGDHFFGFDVATTVYKRVNGHGIALGLLTPKNMQPGKHPLMIRYHGGFLVTGATLFPGFFARWILQYALKYSAIIVSPDYRLLPESNGLDIMDDLSDLWKWVHRDLNSFVSEVREGIEVDLERILLVGESAGGYLTVQLGLSQESSTIKAIISTSPSLDLRTPHYSTNPPPTLFGFPTLPPMDNYLALMKAGEIVTSADPPTRMPLAISIVQQGKLLDLLGTESRLYPMDQLERINKFPPLFITHGENDSAVPMQGSVNFVEKLKKVLPESQIVLYVHPGVDHGFDRTAEASDQWLQEGLNMITEAWLG